MKLLLALALAVPLAAHDLYLLPSEFFVSPGQAITVAIHNGDAFPESESPPALERLRDAILITATAVYNVTNLRIIDKAALGSAVIKGQGNEILAVRTVPHFIELEAPKFLEYLKEEGLGHVIDWRNRHAESAKPGRERYSKYAKALVLSVEPSEAYRNSAGHTLEIFPERNPYTLKPGEALPIQVRLRGKPAGDLQIQSARASGEVRIAGRTDSAGRLRVPITEAGKWRLHTIAMERCGDPKAADWESYWASLTFAVE